MSIFIHSFRSSTLQLLLWREKCFGGYILEPSLWRHGAGRCGGTAGYCPAPLICADAAYLPCGAGSECVRQNAMYWHITHSLHGLVCPACTQSAADPKLCCLPDGLVAPPWTGITCWADSTDADLDWLQQLLTHCHSPVKCCAAGAACARSDLDWAVTTPHDESVCIGRQE